MYRGSPCQRPETANQEADVAAVIGVPSLSLTGLTVGNTEDHGGPLGQTIYREGVSDRVLGVLRRHESQRVATSNRADCRANPDSVTL